MSYIKNKIFINIQRQLVSHQKLIEKKREKKHLRFF